MKSEIEIDNEKLVANEDKKLDVQETKGETQGQENKILMMKNKL
jgi:hypothetical protein